MNRLYIGRLSEQDPLHGYLQHDIQAQINGSTGHSTYRVFRLNGSNDVYLYEDRKTDIKVIGKFFLSSGKKDVIGFDLERTKRADRVFDTGRIAGELKHFFMRATGHKDAADPFGHFLWEYACHFPNRLAHEPCPS